MAFPDPIVITETLISDGLHVLTGNVTIDAGNLVVSSGLVTVPANPGLGLVGQIPEDVPDSQWSTLTQWGVQFARGGLTIADGVVTLPDGAGGVYIITGSYEYSSGLPATHHIGGRILVNNAEVVQRDMLSDGHFNNVGIQAITPLGDGDTVVFQAYQGTGAGDAYSILGDTTKTFSLWRLG